MSWFLYSNKIFTKSPSNVGKRFGYCIYISNLASLSNRALQCWWKITCLHITCIIFDRCHYILITSVNIPVCIDRRLDEFAFATWCRKDRAHNTSTFIYILPISPINSEGFFFATRPCSRVHCRPSPMLKNACFNTVLLPRRWYWDWLAPFYNMIQGSRFCFIMFV